MIKIIEIIRKALSLWWREFVNPRYRLKALYQMFIPAIKLSTVLMSWLALIGILAVNDELKGA
jgi:hypothetical protein